MLSNLRNHKSVLAKCLIALMLLSTTTLSVHAERLKDIADIAGVRDNPLIGYGLVVGLDGTGDQTTQTPFTSQSFRSMLQQLGIQIPEGESFQLKNVAAVTVHATLPPFAKPGQNIDVQVSSIGNSKSLRGGSLLMSPLKGADGQVYAIAQGELVVGGFGAEGADGSSVTVNIPSAGRIPNGAIVERMIANSFSTGTHLTFNLNRADFTTARRVAESINELLGPDVARAADAASIHVTAPRDPNQRVSFMSLLENVEVDPGKAPARVIINSRTGTIVVGEHVRVRAGAVTHGSLTVTITSTAQVSQPNALAGGRTVVVPQTDVSVSQEANRMFAFEATTTLNELVRAVNEVGAAPGDLMAILEALKQAGALQADLIVI
ncbi:flagellar biosynthesis protein FlgI [Oceanicoccus sagamiensis]|uniref:Flagellar P-ring protein n=2 Tax=Oceanicoccus sagamiensis TaxID=716816 RepID=A0A1X9NLJ3_9GAMM|nr:flagellar biosynthesis protein FlgI [Oceanicoccus sagamiensis]